MSTTATTTAATTTAATMRTTATAPIGTFVAVVAALSMPAVALSMVLTARKNGVFEQSRVTRAPPPPS